MTNLISLLPVIALSSYFASISFHFKALFLFLCQSYFDYFHLKHFLFYLMLEYLIVDIIIDHFNVFFLRLLETNRNCCNYNKKTHSNRYLCFLGPGPNLYLMAPVPIRIQQPRPSICIYQPRSSSLQPENNNTDIFQEKYFLSTERVLSKEQ